MSCLEIFGVVTGLISVWLTVRQNIWCWPTGIISVVAYGYLFFNIKLYADMGLQVFFLAAGVFGWYQWLHGGRDRSALKIGLLPAWQRWLVVAASPGLIWVIGRLLDVYTDASIPYWDSTISGLSILAQVLLDRKILENWYIWILVDVISIGVYVYKEIYLTAGLYLVFLVLACMGLLHWQAQYGRQRSGPGEPAVGEIP